MEVLGHAVAGVVGVWVVAVAMSSAVRTVVLPRGVPSRLSRSVFSAVRFVFRLRLGRAPSYEARDRVMATYSPVALLAMLGTWLVLAWLGFGLLQLAGTGLGLRGALVESGSSLLTLGVRAPVGAVSTGLAFLEAAVGLVLVALLISYLPALYGAFSRREGFVAKLEVRAGRPPTGGELLRRAYALENVEWLATLWLAAEDYFTDVEESHTSFPALVFFRSPQPDQSWVTAAGAVLDGASLRASVLDAPRSLEAELCIRSGYLALRRIAAFFDVPYPEDPQPGDPISVSRDELEEVLDELEASGVPVTADRDQAWRDFAGWRVNYDVALVALATLTQAPYAPWSSDRTLTALRPGRRGLRRGR